MAEQFILKVCSITFRCCDRFSQCSMNDGGPFHDYNIQASFADKCTLKAARPTGQPQTYIDIGVAVLLLPEDSVSVEHRCLRI